MWKLKSTYRSTFACEALPQTDERGSLEWKRYLRNHPCIVSEPDCPYFCQRRDGVCRTNFVSKLNRAMYRYTHGGPNRASDATFQNGHATSIGALPIQEKMSVANLSVVDDIRPPWSLKDVTARIGLTRIWHLEATLYRWNLCACPWSCSVALQVFNKTNPSFQQAKNHGRSLHPEEWACTLLLPFALHRQCSRKLVACVAPAEKWGCRCPILTSICAHQPWKYWTGVRARRTYSGTTVLILS